MFIAVTAILAAFIPATAGTCAAAVGAQASTFALADFNQASPEDRRDIVLQALASTVLSAAAGAVGPYISSLDPAVINAIMGLIPWTAWLYSLPEGDESACKAGT